MKVTRATRERLRRPLPSASPSAPGESRQEGEEERSSPRHQNNSDLCTIGKSHWPRSAGGVGAVGRTHRSELFSQKLAYAPEQSRAATQVVTLRLGSAAVTAAPEAGADGARFGLSDDPFMMASRIASSTAADTANVSSHPRTRARCGAVGRR